MFQHVWDSFQGKLRVFYNYVFTVSRIVLNSFFAYCLKALPTFVQFPLCSNLFSKYESNCTKVGMAFQHLAKNESITILLTEKT